MMSIRTKAITLEQKIAVLFIVIFMIIAIISYFMYQSKSEQLESYELVTHSYNIETDIKDINNVIQKAEIIKNKLFFDKDVNTIKTYIDIFDTVRTKIDRLKLILTKNSIQNGYLDSLEKIIDDDSMILKQVININKKHSTLEARDYLLSQGGDIFFEQIQYYISTMEYEEQQLLEVRSNRTKRSSDKAFKTFYLSVFAQLIILAAFFVIIRRDIIARRKAENELAENKRELQNIIDAAPILIFVKDDEGNYKIVNRFFEQYTGLSSQNIIGKKIRDILPGNDTEMMHDQDIEIIKNKKPILRIEELVNTTNGPRWFITNKVPYIDETGSVTQIIGVSAEITDRKTAELALKESEDKLRELNRKKDKLFAIISHDLRSPFIGLLGYTEYLINSPELDKIELKTIFNDLYNVTKRTYNLVEDLLQWSYSQQSGDKYLPEKINIFDISKLVIERLKANAEKKEISIINQIDDKTKVIADKRLLESVFLNLVTNAIKFTFKGGEIKLISKRIDNEIVEISIQDNGRGIPEEDLKKLFKFDEKYTNIGTENEQGTGLGLPICKEFVEKMGGEIDVESRIESGTTFRFTLSAV